MSEPSKTTSELLVMAWILLGAVVGYAVGVSHTRYSARVNGAAHYIINDSNNAEFRWGPKSP